MKFRSGKENVNYLDDFLFVALLKAMCNVQMEVFLNTCQKINFPIAEEKTFWSSTQMVFLGFLIDTIRQIVMVLVEKLEKGKTLIGRILDSPKKKATVKQIQSICGFLNFLGRCILPGCAFTRRLYAHMSNGNLKAHHHVRVNLEMRADLAMWLTFLNHPSAFVRGFIDMSRFHYATEIRMASDASKAISLGFGAICGDSWTYAQWPEGFIEQYDPSIAYLELYALVVGVKLWIHRFANKRVVLLCDNQSVIQMVNNTMPSCKDCMILIRLLVLESLYNNVRIFARFVRSQDNTAPDMLARLKIDAFKQLKHWEPEMTDIPESLWPIQKCLIPNKAI